MDYKEQFQEVKNVLEAVKVPRNTNLAFLKIKETLEIDNSDINEDASGIEDSYSIRYENLLIYVNVDYLHQKFKVANHFDVMDEADNIIECY